MTAIPENIWELAEESPRIARLFDEFQKARVALNKVWHDTIVLMSPSEAMAATDDERQTMLSLADDLTDALAQHTA